MRSFLISVALAVLMPTVDVRADDVDWSEYIDNSSQKPTESATADSAAPAAPARVRAKRVARPAKKVVNKRVKAKRRVKTTRRRR
jgi:hypothetical protein